jgi:hypothetical protein
VLNNATFAPAGLSVAETPITDWDRSYAVNLRGPVLLARACLQSMLARGRGVFVCVSSTGGPYLGAYETLKAAQLTLADTLDTELAGTGVTAFTIGPGLVATATAAAAIERVAPRLGLSLKEFYSMNRGAMLSVEAAGAGFAAAVALAALYAGQEISSSQALIDAGIDIPEDVEVPAGVNLAAAAHSQAQAVPRASRAAGELCDTVRSTLVQQAARGGGTGPFSNGSGWSATSGNGPGCPLSAGLKNSGSWANPCTQSRTGLSSPTSRTCLPSRHTTATRVTLPAATSKTPSSGTSSSP